MQKIAFAFLVGFTLVTVTNIATSETAKP